MINLQESLFGDNITRDPFETILDRLDTKEYTPEIAIEALDQLFKIGGKKYGFYSMGSKKETFLQAIRKDNWVMLARKNYDGSIDGDYSFIYPHHRNNGLLLQFFITWKNNWFCDDIDIGWATNSDFGSKEIINRLENMHFEECILITDKKIKDAIKNRLEELTK